MLILKMKFKEMTAVYLIVAFAYTLLLISKQYSCKILEKRLCGIITYKYTPSTRLGNNLFMYASLMGIALQNERSFCVNKYSLQMLRKVFDTRAIECNCSVTFTNYFIDESYWLPGHFHHMQTKNLPCTHLELNTYLQSYKYFDKSKNDILIDLIFHSVHMENAAAKLKHFSPRNNVRKKTVIAHLRRGDFLNDAEKAHGYVAVDKAYILSAFEHILLSNKLQRNETNLFLIGDDYNRIKSEFSDVDYAIPIKTSETAAVDLALSKFADFVIISTGTFSWWFGYLSSAVVYRPKIFCNNTLCEDYTENDYMMPQWIAI